jgi:hypothetical protein
LLTLAAPLWLCGLALLPLIRWLHRGGRHRRTVAVAQLGLWRGAEVKLPAAGERRPPDPAWRRRALLAALLFIALAGPQWPPRQAAITLWVNDSFSMLTREVQGTRLDMALAQARALLAQAPHGDVALRTLGDPWRRQRADTDQAVLARGVGRQETAPPPAALLRGDSQHWLLTDGADARLFNWPGGRQPDRVIQVGAVTRNVGLERLAARLHPDDPQRVDLLIKLSNGGTVAETRELVVASAVGEVARRTQQLEAGATSVVQLTMPAAASVRATLVPGDALAEDDVMVLDLAPLRRRRVAVDAACPAALRAAVSAHPALALAADPDAVLACAPGGMVRTLPTVRMLAERVPVRLPGAPQWSPAVPEWRRVRLDGAELQVAAALARAPGDTTLLAIGEVPVILSRAGTPALIDSALDFTAPPRTGGTAMPLLVNLMFEQLLGAPLLDPIAVAERGPLASRVAPAERTVATTQAAAPAPARGVSDGTAAVLLTALLVLAWEIVALARQWWHLRPAAASSA